MNQTKKITTFQNGKFYGLITQYDGLPELKQVEEIEVKGLTLTSADFYLEELKSYYHEEIELALALIDYALTEMVEAGELRTLEFYFPIPVVAYIKPILIDLGYVVQSAYFPTKAMISVGLVEL